MKKTLTMGIILLFAGLVITSCNKSSDEISAPQAEKQGSDLMAFLQTPQGKTAMETCAKLVKGETVDKEIFVQFTLITLDNIGDYLP